ncbi:MAG: flagellar basal body L-ring protein FlgH [Acidobacteria bacterium]|nr:flagellar basal body L-ring protein FlgH [Acidobacteriota bacterium]
MMTTRLGCAVVLLFATDTSAAARPKSKAEPCTAETPESKTCTALDRYLLSVAADAPRFVSGATPGSLYTPGGRITDLGRDFRALYPGDTVTVVVSDRATAIASGSTNTSRKSNVNAGISAALGPLKASGPLANLAGATSDSKLQGTGSTSRTMQLSTTVTSVVERVLPNGNLLLRGSKSIAVNSERQVVEVRGIIRPEDLQSGNTVASDRMAMLDIKVNGKGVVGDSVRRPFILYRLLMGLLPI